MKPFYSKSCSCNFISFNSVGAMWYSALEIGLVPGLSSIRSLQLVKEKLLVNPLGRHLEIRLLWIPYPLFSLFLLRPLRMLV